MVGYSGTNRQNGLRLYSPARRFQAILCSFLNRL